MKRSFVIALLLSLGVAAAQTTGPTAIPNVFTDGTKMSASAMNENLQALEDRMDVIREAVIETRREQVKLRDRVDLLTEATPSGAATGSFESAYPQQAEEPAWPFAAGDLVDANLVNRAFSDFQDAADNIDEFSRLLMKDMQTISDKISALEQLYSLPVGEGFEAELFAYVPPTAKKFQANERIVTADVNANFGQLWASLDVLEHNVEEAMAAVKHEAQRYYELEEIAGPPALAEESYLLPLQGVLDDEDFSATTEIWYAVLERITPSGPSRAWPDTNGFSLSPSGEYDFVIDARDVAYDIDPLSPQGLADWLLPFSEPLTQERTLAISNEYAGLHPVISVEVEQVDLAGQHLPSHTLDFWVDHQLGDESPSSSWPVFADRPVTITGTLTYTSTGKSIAIDVDLEPGWNLVYPVRQPSQPIFLRYESRPVNEDDAPTETLMPAIFGMATDAGAVRGYSFFPWHEISEAAPAATFSALADGSATFMVTGPAWFNHDVAPLKLVSIEDAFPGTAADTLTTDTPSARYALVNSVAYDEAAIEAGSLGVYAASSGVLQGYGADDQPVLHLYASESSTIHIDVVDDSGPGAFRLKTEAGGLDLGLGWNTVEFTSDGAEPGEAILIAYTGPVTYAFEPNP